MRKTAEQTPGHDGPPPARATQMVLRDTPPPPGMRWRRFAVKLVALALIWGVLTEFRVDALYFGVPAILLGAALVFAMPVAPGWRISPAGAVSFALWFAVQSVRGAVDVAQRAFSPAMPLRPGFRSYAPDLPGGAPRVMFLNTITLLPGTLSAEVEGDEVIVHMLDTRADLEADLGALEARIAALFGLNVNPRGST